jgi:hypothetical protein
MEELTAFVVSVYQITRRNIPEDSHIYARRYDNLKLRLEYK